MEKQTRIVIYSLKAIEDVDNIREYGCEMFSPHAAEVFVEELFERADGLSETYLYHTECRYLPTKTKKYRMLVFHSYLVVYRIAAKRIEVLRIVHSSQNISVIRDARTIKIP